MPENIPHLSSPVSATNSGNGNSLIQSGLPGPPGPNKAGSPVKESSFLHRETSADDQDAFGVEREDADKSALGESGQVEIQGQS